MSALGNQIRGFLLLMFVRLQHQNTSPAAVPSTAKINLTSTFLNINFGSQLPIYKLITKPCRYEKE